MTQLKAFSTAVLALGLLTFGSTSLPADDASPLIVVDAGKTLGPVNRFAFGHNIEACDARGIFGEPLNAPKCNPVGVLYAQGFWNPSQAKPAPEIVSATKELGIGMLRYPGGCLAHNYDWRKAAGPRAERPDWQFGIDEYITLCRELGAEPLFTVSDYVLPAEEMPAHAAELVEYLNSPATPEHPWALKRKAAGHPEPYGVKWFELGNESDHGNHHCQPGRRFSPADYVAYATSVSAAMRKVDPTIKIGVLTVPSSGENFDCAWNKAVYAGACPSADFLIVHYYGPGVDGTEPDAAFTSAMAYADQLEWRMAQYRRMTKEASGRALPLAVTEYNISSGQEEPCKYRFSYTAGLLCADLLRLWLEPSNDVAIASYWHVANGFFGMFNTKDGHVALKRASLPFFQLWGAHCGDLIVKSSVVNPPLLESFALPGVAASKGSEMVFGSKICDASLAPFDVKALTKPGLTPTVVGNSSLSLKLEGYGKEAYLDFSKFLRPAGLPADSGFTCKLSFEARFTPSPASTGKAVLGLGLGDLRGWGKVKSAVAVSGIQEAREWTHFEGTLNARHDCPGAGLLVRFENLSGAVSGLLEVRDIKVEIDSPMISPAYRGLTTFSSLSKDGKTLYLMVFNKQFAAPLKTEIDLKGFDCKSAKSWTLFQENVATTDFFEPESADLKFSGSKFSHVFPPHSMTALEFKR